MKNIEFLRKLWGRNKKSWTEHKKLWKENTWVRRFVFLLIIGLVVICFVDYCLFKCPFWTLTFRWNWWKTQPLYVMIIDIVMHVLLFISLLVVAWKTFKEVSQTKSIH